MTKRITALLLGILASITGFAQVTFLVQQLPANTPPADTLYVAGNFQGWNPANSATKLLPIGNGLFACTLPLTASIQYKYTRGSWASVEGNSLGGFRPNRSKTVAAGDTLRDTILSWEDLGAPGGNSTAQPNVTRIAGFYMPQLNRTRAVWVCLPPDYAGSQKHYPVLYMHDGQNVFDAYTSFVGEWEVDETLNDLQQDSADYGCIVVAIESDANRINELTPYHHPQYGGGEGDAYTQFIIQTLKPWVDSAYRTLAAPEFTAIGGSSLGGLLTFYAHQTYSQVFGKALVFSPSYWFNDSVYRLPASNANISSGRILQLAGALEANGSVVQAINRMQDSLLVHGINAANVRTSAKADGQHSEWFWRREFGSAYRWLFKQTYFSADEVEFYTSRGYPNPVGNHFTIQSCNGCTALVFDTTGRLIADFTALLLQEPPTADGQQTLSGLNALLQPGMYYLQVYQQGSISIYPFLKE
jgi:metallo-beta-lactamase class B